MQLKYSFLIVAVLMITFCGVCDLFLPVNAQQQQDAAEAGGVDTVLPSAEDVAYTRRQKIHHRGVMSQGEMQKLCPSGSRASISKTVPRFGLCTHGHTDVVSGWFMKDGFWRDCLQLPILALTTKLSSGANPILSNASAPFVVEVGGNIGSCALLLASQGCDVVSFEPLKSNYQVFNASIIANKMQDQVTLINAGASSVTDFAHVRTEKGNLGNTILESGNGNAQLSKLGINFLKKQEVKLVRIDDYVDRRVNLMKLDCQGSELIALQGARQLLKNHGVDILQVEFDPTLLQAVGSDPIDLLKFIWRFGYTIYDGNGAKALLVNDTLRTAPRIASLQMKDVESFMKQRAKYGATDLVCLHSRMLRSKTGKAEERFLLNAVLKNSREPLETLWIEGQPVIPVRR